MAGLQISSEAELEAFMQRCSPKIRQQMKDQINEQNTRHGGEGSTQETQPIVHDPIPPRKVQPRQEPEPIIAEQVQDPIVVAVKKIKEVPKRYWVVLLICLKTLFSTSLGESMLLCVGMYICFKFYLWKQRRKDRRILKALERQARQRELNNR